MKNIAIIGGGLAGASLCTELVRQLAAASLPEVTITLFEPRSEIGPGTPYHKSVKPRYLLNHEMDHMGAVNVQDGKTGEDDFYHWVETNRSSLQKEYPDTDLSDKNNFVPRPLYGRYLAARFEETQTFAMAHGIEINIIPHVVIDLYPAQSAGAVVEYETPEGVRTMHFDKATLAVGHWFSKNAHMARTPRYAMATESQSIPGKMRPGHEIVIMGTGQTADETALMLLDEGAPQVTMISRRGWLHAVRGAYQPYVRAHLTIPNLVKYCGKGNPFTLEACFELFKRDVEDAYGHAIDWREIFAPKDPREMLRTRVQECLTGEPLPWRSVLASLTDIRQEIYERLAPAERERFHDDYRTLFFCYNAPIPMTIAERMLSAMDQGKLTVQGGLQTVAWNEQKQAFELWFSTRKDTEGHPLPAEPASAYRSDDTLQCLQADWLVEARGQSRDVSALPLGRNMLDKGTVLKAREGGIRINVETHQVIGHKGENPDIYVLGPMTIGEYLIISNSIPPTRHAREIAENIVQNLQLSGAEPSLAEKYKRPVAEDRKRAL